MRILIADDHPFIRRGIKQIVADELPGSVLGEAQTCPEVLQSVRNGAWDLVVLDLAMPGGDGLEVLRQIKASKPKLPVLVLTMHTEDQFGVLVMREGAAGYLTKRAAPDELVKAIRKISEGSKYITSTLAEKLAHEIDKGTDKPRPQASLHPGVSGLYSTRRRSDGRRNRRTSSRSATRPSASFGRASSAKWD